jgi:hypothetical protein
MFKPISSQGSTESFKNIEPVMQKKCFDCNDNNTKNPVYHHHQDVIKALLPRFLE